MNNNSYLRILFAALAATAWLSGCSSSDSDSTTPAPGSCIQDPWSCPAGQTCLATDSTNTEFKCVKSGTGDVGDTCQGTAGTAECKDGLTCVWGHPSTCAPYCDPAKAEHGCPAMYSCMAATTDGGISMHVCVPPIAAGDSGAPETGPDGASGDDAAADAAADGP